MTVLRASLTAVQKFIALVSVAGVAAAASCWRVERLLERCRRWEAAVASRWVDSNWAAMEVTGRICGGAIPAVSTLLVLVWYIFANILGQQNRRYITTIGDLGFKNCSETT